MSSYIDFSNYSDTEILRMQKEKKKEYIILIQSEKIATKLLNYYGSSLYTTNYHYRVNSEYYLLQERVIKKKIALYDEEVNPIIKISIESIIARLNDSKSELLKINSSLYEQYNIIVNEIIDKINNLDLSIFYHNGTLYALKDGEEIILDDNNINELLNSKQEKIKNKTLN